ncbi:flagellar motor switch protein FliN [Oligoflexia bacterium]|nr:flagellar motor switch protein FliN [Oligoflexia bacterium]
MYKTPAKEELLRTEGATEARSIDFLEDVTLQISVELGEAEMSIRDLLKLQSGSVIELNKRSDEPFDFRVNGKLTAKGEVVVVNDKYGIRITAVVGNNLDLNKT